MADELCIIRSMHTDQFNHAPAQLFVHTGSPRLGRPGMGAWLSYGLGTENRNLPSFVVLVSGTAAPDGGASLWGSGFLPTIHQGVQLRSQGDPVLFLSNPDGMDAAGRRQSLDALKALNQLQLDAVGDPGDRHAHRAVRDGLPDADQRAGDDGHLQGDESRPTNCTAPSRARRRSPTTACWPGGWWRAACVSCSSTTGAGTATASRMANDLRYGLVERCQETDQPIAALIKDLKQRGLLDQTLVVWGGEFGRTPMNEERNGSKWLGRDHHQHAFTIWMAGGGVKAGLTLRRDRRPRLSRRGGPRPCPRLAGDDPAPAWA